ncbi:hypothetical protein HYW42_00810 [Candidatus Daviesbacteria bacterium]|nr:hypothetical protein [Candidatus Daviesbacteria bacterium]
MSKQVNKKMKQKATKLVRISAELHRRLKIESAITQTTIGELIEKHLV